MGLDYGPLYRGIFTHPKFEPLSRDAHSVYLYLLAQCQSPSGIALLNLTIACRLLKMNETEVMHGLAELACSHPEKPLAMFDPASSTTFITGSYKRSLIKSPNHMRAIGNQFVSESALPFWYEFFLYYPEIGRYLLRAKHYKNQGDFKRLMVGLAPTHSSRADWAAVFLSPIEHLTVIIPTPSQGLIASLCKGLPQVIRTEQNKNRMRTEQNEILRKETHGKTAEKNPPGTTDYSTGRRALLQAQLAEVEARAKRGEPLE